MKQLRKKLIAGILCLAMLVGCFPVTNFAWAQEKSSVIQGDGFTAEFCIESAWDKHCNVSVKVTNTSEEIIENWTLTYEQTGEIINIWNAQIVTHEGNSYTIKNAGWNQDIPVNGSINFGYTLQGEMLTLPNVVTSNQAVLPVSDVMYQATYVLQSSWENGQSACIELKNISSTTIEDWILTFAFEGEITSLWNGEILIHEGNIYTVKNPSYQQNLAPGQVIQIGFLADIEDGEASGFSLWQQVEASESEIEKDTDNDGLGDYVEVAFGLNPDTEDTDGDSLSDVYEFLYTGTSPWSADSDANGTSDEKEDRDGDGLTNGEEYQRGTSAIKADTDGDGLEDGEEVNAHKTNPLVYDTDGDGLSDGEEITLGLSPLETDTDGDGIPDGKERIEQTVEYEVFSENYEIWGVSVQLDATGNAQTTTQIRSLEGEDLLSCGVIGLVGVPFEIETTSEFTEATITFHLDTDYLEIPPEQLMFLWYDEENGTYEELETVYNSNDKTISTVTNHFSRYMIVDKEAWYAAWAIQPDYNPNAGKDEGQRVSYQTVLAVDCSGSMSGNDPITLYTDTDGTVRNSCNRMEAARGFINNMSVYDYSALLTFTGSAEVHVGLTQDKEALLAAVERIYSYGGTDYNDALTEALNLFPEETVHNEQYVNRVILITDGEDYANSSVLQDAKENGIIVYTVGFGDDSYDYELERIATYTGGEFFKVLTGDELVKLYQTLGVDTGDFDKTDTDGDGLYDAVETGGIRLQNGRIIYTDPTSQDTDGDGLSDNHEINPYIRYAYNYSASSGVMDVMRERQYYFEMWSDPNEADSDLDGADDLTEYVWGTDLLNPDTDGDWLNDWDEYLIGTDARNRDTDGDRVHDGLEVQIWFPPTHSNWDGDAYDDYEEFNKKGTSPYIYNMTGEEYLNCFLSGVLWGDTIREVDNVATLAGQIVGGFCPISDLRDYFANGYYGDFGTGLLNLFAMIPAMGDVASIANRVGKFIVNHTYDIAKMTEVLLFAAKNCPDVFKYLGKQDEILSYVKYLKAQKTLPITRMDATDVNNVLESLGCTDDLIKHGDDVGVRPAILDDVAEGGIKSGKELIKNIRKVEYGTDELSKVAIEYRKANNITSARRNVCVVEYQNVDGTIVRKAFASNTSNHSEELMLDYLKEDNITGENVIKIFTEREPCVETASNVGHNCANRIIEYTPNAEVTYVVDYGITQEDGLNARNILQELLQNLLE